MNVTKEMINKLRVGEKISDNELTLMIDFFTKLEQDLLVLGNDFFLPRFYISQELNKLISYQSARKR